MLRVAAPASMQSILKFFVASYVDVSTLTFRLSTNTHPTNVAFCRSGSSASVDLPGCNVLTSSRSTSIQQPKMRRWDLDASPHTPQICVRELSPHNSITIVAWHFHNFYHDYQLCSFRFAGTHAGLAELANGKQG